MPEVHIGSTGAQLDYTVSRIPVFESQINDARLVADQAARTAATAGVRTEEVNNALSSRIARIEAQLGIFHEE